MKRFFADAFSGATGAVIAACILAVATFIVGRVTASDTVIQVDNARAIAASIDSVESSDGSDQINDTILVSGHVQNLPEEGSEIRLLVKHDQDVDYYLNPAPIQVNEDGSWSEGTTLGDPDLRVPAPYNIYVVFASPDVLEAWAAENALGSPELDTRMSLLTVNDVTREV